MVTTKQMWRELKDFLMFVAIIPYAAMIINDEKAEKRAFEITIAIMSLIGIFIVLITQGNW